MPQTRHQQPIFVAGAGGYIGGRLVPRLLEAGYRVRSLARSPEKLRNRRCGKHPHLEIIQGDILDYPSLLRGLEGCRAAYYLVHSMNQAVADFSPTDRAAAKHLT
ncbi:MAG: NAD(P)H-binding protein, partial [Geopsychrobacter sp.]|nr:NAD(P)H-binding protein [Geopsychrobacter sp.]